MTIRDSKTEAAKAATQDVYNRHAHTWDNQRSRSLYERSWLDRFAACITHEGTLLDVGCGTGDPVGEYFLKNGFQLVGIDYSKPMIDIAREKYPQAEWIVQDMRMLDVGRVFDGIYSWDGFFHLSTEEQRGALPELAKHIKQGGAILLTVGPGEGEVTGTVGGETVYHASLCEDEYRDLLKASGFQKIEFVPEDPDCLGRSVLMASERQVSV